MQNRHRTCSFVSNGVNKDPIHKTGEEGTSPRRRRTLRQHWKGIWTKQSQLLCPKTRDYIGAIRMPNYVPSFYFGKQRKLEMQHPDCFRFS